VQSPYVEALETNRGRGNETEVPHARPPRLLEKGLGGRRTSREVEPKERPEGSPWREESQGAGRWRPEEPRQARASRSENREVGQGAHHGAALGGSKGYTLKHDREGEGASGMGKEGAGEGLSRVGNFKARERKPSGMQCRNRSRAQSRNRVTCRSGGSCHGSSPGS
jgi:hypothetical protein